MDALFAAPVGALLIFSLRIIDVSMSMMRMILAVRGHRGLAAFIGFFEVLIWLFAAGHALEHLDSVWHIVGYAGGFATGNYIGVWLEGRFALGLSAVRVIFRGNSEHSSGPAAAAWLRNRGFAVTEQEGRGRESEVDILNIVVQRKRVPEVLGILQELDPTAFVTVTEVRTASGGVLEPSTTVSPRLFVRPGGRKIPYLTRV